MSYLDTTVREQYNRWAAIYDQRWQRYVRETLHFLVEWAQLPSDSRVLDVACGTGALAELLLHERAQRRIVGVDFAEQMLRVAQAKFANEPRVQLHQGRAEALPLRSGQFTAVVCANAFHYFRAPQAVLAEMQRVSTPTSQLIILDWCRDFLLCNLYDLLLKRIDPGYQVCYREAELHALLAASGWRVVRSQRVRFGHFWGLMAVEARRC